MFGVACDFVPYKEWAMAFFFRMLKTDFATDVGKSISLIWLWLGYQ